MPLAPTPHQQDSHDPDLAPPSSSFSHGNTPLGALEAEIGAPEYGEFLNRFPNLMAGSTLHGRTMLLERVFGEDRRRLAAVAAAALKHRYQLTNSHQVDLGSRIDWLRDPITGYRWCMKDFLRSRRLDENGQVDPRRIWALARCNHFLPMALEYLLTDNADYPLEFTSQVTSWVEQNECQSGVNWMRASETALRCIGWLLAFKVFSLRWSFSADFERLLAVELYRAGKHICGNLERISPGFNDTSYLANLVGLLYLGELFRGAGQGEDWRRFAISELERESDLQVDADGFCRESSLAYHGLAAELLLFAYLLAERAAFSFSPAFRDRLRRMLLILSRFARSDGLIAPFGDTDCARLASAFPRHQRDFQGIVSIGERVLGITNSEAPAVTPEELLLTEVQAAASRPWPNSECPKSLLLKEAGICQLRSRQLTLNLFANAIGGNGCGSHKHNDILSFTLEFRGKQVFVDPGSCSLMLGRDWRNRFRSTANHNTVMLDGLEQNRMVGHLPGVLRNDSHPRITLWKTDGDSDLVVADSDSYERLGDPVHHRRAIFLDKQAEVILIRDELAGREPHEVSTNFLLAVSEISELGRNQLRLKTGQSGEELLFSLLDSDVGFAVSSDWISNDHGATYPLLRLRVRALIKLPTTFLYAIAAPRDVGVAQVLESISRTRRKIRW